jgi:hypothetical protein
MDGRISHIYELIADTAQTDDIIGSDDGVMYIYVRYLVREGR